MVELYINISPGRCSCQRLLPLVYTDNSPLTHVWKSANLDATFRQLRCDGYFSGCRSLSICAIKTQLWAGLWSHEVKNSPRHQHDDHQVKR